jgi:hypothetical protein
MEQLIFRNLYGFLVSDIEAPVLMQDEDVPLFEEAVRWSRRDEDWESFERMFGTFWRDMWRGCGEHGRGRSAFGGHSRSGAWWGVERVRDRRADE